MGSRGHQGGSHALTRGPRRNWSTSKKSRSSKQPQKLDGLIENTKGNLKGHGAKSVWFHQSGFFELTTCKGQKKRFRVSGYKDQRLEVLEQADDHPAWKLLESRVAECEASAIAFLDAQTASSSHPGPDKDPPSEGSEDTDVEVESEEG